MMSKQRSIRLPDALAVRMDEIAIERQTSFTEIVITACMEFFELGEEFRARQDKRTVSGRVPVAEESRPKVARPAKDERLDRARAAMSNPDVSPKRYGCRSCDFTAMSPKARCSRHAGALVER